MILLTAEQVQHLSVEDRSLLATLIERLDYLTIRIQEEAARGRPVGRMRLERKALRWAVEARGIVLPPNPPVPFHGPPPSPRSAPASTPDVGEDPQ